MLLVPRRRIERPTYGLGNRAQDDGSDCSQGSCDELADCVALCVALLEKKSADLAIIVRTWNDLPEAIRQGILAMVTAAGRSSGGSA